MAHSPEGWEDFENGLNSETEEDKYGPEIDFKVLQHQAFTALEEAHNWERDGIHSREARNNLCNSLPGHNGGEYVALAETGDSTEILLAGFESVDGEIYAQRNPEIDPESELYQALIDNSDHSQQVEEYLEKSVPMEEVAEKELSFPSESKVVRLYAPDLEY